MADKSITRIETFSDGVFAIAITLLILEIKVPKLENSPTNSALWHQLCNLWPSYFAFVVSFGSILIMWANHHKSFKMITGISQPFLFANGFLLLTITFIPFPTAVLAEYINTPSMGAAVAFYNIAFLLCNIGYNVFWEAMRRPMYLLKPGFTPQIIKRISRDTRSGFAVYGIAIIVSLWWPIMGLILNACLYVLWITLQLSENVKPDEE